MWDLPAGTVCGRKYSLNEIEHDELRKKWDEPAVHACIVCASASCPDLRPQAFVASKLREQMDDQLRAWMANPTKGFVADQGTGEIKMSRIFLWFADDFGGSTRTSQARLSPRSSQPHRRPTPPTHRRRTLTRAQVGLESLRFSTRSRTRRRPLPRRQVLASGMAG